MDRLRMTSAAAVSMGLIGLALWSGAPALGQGTPRPRPGLTAQQTKEAVELAKGAMRELRKKTEGALNPDADAREYIVNVELLSTKERASSPPADGAAAKNTEPAKSDAPEKAPAPRAVVTSYRYFDDITVFSTVDLQTGRVIKVEAAQHLRTPLSQGEFEDAVALARERSEEVKKLYEHFGDELSVYPQFSQYTVKDDPRIHRVVHLTFRVGKRDLSYPRPQVDLTTREVETPAPEPEPKVRPRQK
jgi:hypothetical protein